MVEGSEDNRKITTADDLAARCIGDGDAAPPSASTCTASAPGNQVMLGGVAHPARPRRWPAIPTPTWRCMR